MLNTLKTTFLMTAMVVLFMAGGLMLGGRGGMLAALVIAGSMNFVMYWFSDRIILARYGAEEIPEDKYTRLQRIVSRLAAQASIPRPDIYLISEDNPNAFATGRNSENAAVAVTSGLLELMDEEELEAVIAHELSHIQNKDTLISVIAATMAGAISFLATMARWGAMFGGFGGRGRRNNLVVILVMSIVAPLAATIIQLAISRSREYKADRSAAELTNRPLALASALQKLQKASEKRPLQRGDNQSAHLFIVNPFTKEGFSKLFSTHPSVEQRVKELKKLPKT